MQMSNQMEGEGGCLSTTIMDHQERDLAISTQQATRKYWLERKRKHQQMLKDKVDTSTKGMIVLVVMWI